MSKLRNKTWARDFLLLPLIVGIVIAGVAFVLPRIVKDKLELSYIIYHAERQFDNPAIQSARIEINGIKVSELYAYKVRLWNSGNKAIKNLSVSFVFENVQGSFQVISANHATNPPYEFGAITENDISETHRRSNYALLNSGDEDIVTMLTTESGDLSVFAKAEGLTLRRVIPEEEKKSHYLSWIALLASGSSLLTGILSYFWFWVRRRTSPELKVMRRILEERDQRLQSVADLLYGDIEIAVARIVKCGSLEDFVGQSGWRLRREDNIDSRKVMQSVGNEVASASSFVTELDAGPQVGMWYATKSNDLIMDEGAYQTILSLYKKVRGGMV